MKRFAGLAVVAVVAVMVASGWSSAADQAVAKGRVTAVSEKAVTVAGANGDTWTFAVTQGAHVYVVGASHRTQALELSGTPRTVDHFVREGQQVRVRYQEKDGTLYLTQLRVL